LVGRQEGHPACKKWGDGGGEHWLVRMEWRPAGWLVSASVNLPLHHKVQKFSSGTGSPGWSRKKGRKMVVVWWCGKTCSRVHNECKIVLRLPVTCVNQPHTDGPLYYPTVTTVSLGDHTVLDFYKPLESAEPHCNVDNCCPTGEGEDNAERPSLAEVC